LSFPLRQNLDNCALRDFDWVIKNPLCSLTLRYN
jgi:hypothetical protein